MLFFRYPICASGWRLTLVVALTLHFASNFESFGNSLEVRVDAYLVSDETNAFGGVVLVARSGEILLAKGYGYENRDSGERLSVSSIFNIGSVSKQLTAAGILKLVEQGKLTLSARLGDVFEGVPPDKRDITVHELLTHSSGIASNVEAFRYKEASKEQFLEACFGAPLWCEPGNGYQYANANYTLLAAIIEQISESSYEAFLHENFFVPLGMKDTAYKGISVRAGLARGYYYDLPQRAWVDWGTTPDHWPSSSLHWNSVGKGDLHSTADDLYRWITALESGEALSKELALKLETPYVKEDESGHSHYAYGWAIFRTPNGGKIVAHNGSNGLFFADVIRFVDDDVVVVFLSNTARPDVWENVAGEISRMVFEEEYQASPIRKFSYQSIHEIIAGLSPIDSGTLPERFQAMSGATIAHPSLLNSIGLQLMKEGQADWAIPLLELNVELFPDNGNLRDSLGEAHFQNRSFDKAKLSFTQALEIAPDHDCSWCENARTRLAEIALIDGASKGY